jgi:HEAT repeat protein
VTPIEREVLGLAEATRGDQLNRIADQVREGRDVGEIFALLDSPNAELVSVGAWILGELGLNRYNSAPFISRLHKLVEHPEPAVRFHAFGALFPALNWDDVAARHLLAKLRRDPNEGVRRSADAAALRVPST